MGHSEGYDRAVLRQAPTINEHIKNIYDEQELSPEATISKMEIVQNEGVHEVKRLIDCYSLDMILPVGFRVRSPSGGSQFRR